MDQNTISIHSLKYSMNSKWTLIKRREKVQSNRVLSVSEKHEQSISEVFVGPKKQNVGKEHTQEQTGECKRQTLSPSPAWVDLVCNAITQMLLCEEPDGKSSWIRRNGWSQRVSLGRSEHFVPSLTHHVQALAKYSEGKSIILQPLTKCKGEAVVTKHHLALCALFQTWFSWQRYFYLHGTFHIHHFINKHHNSMEDGRADQPKFTKELYQS